MLNHHDARGGEDSVRRDRAHNASADAPALTDREVPLGSGPGNAALHAWLDGEGSMAAAAQADRRQVEFWSRLNAEVEVRRQVAAPADLTESIMAALPDTASAVAIAPWWKKDVQLSTVTIVALAVGAFTLGLLAMRVMAS